jgi:hypothetical protein
MLAPRFSRPLLILAGLSLGAGCSYGEHHRDYSDGGTAGGSNTPPGPAENVEQSTIDADQLLDVKPGEGAGAFIEYESGGTYHVTTSCDVDNGGECAWDIVIIPLDGKPLEIFSPYDLEQDDSLTFGYENQLRLLAYTGRDFDGVDFQTEPGAAIQVDALLDDGAANRYLFWVGDGALHSGAPSNPVNLVPSAE